MTPAPVGAIRSMSQLLNTAFIVKDNISTNEYGCLPIKLYVESRQPVRRL